MAITATDVVERLQQAIANILNRSDTLRTLCDRQDRIVVEEDEPTLLQKVPCVTLRCAEISEMGGAGDNREVRLSLKAFATGDGSRGVVNAMLEAIERDLNWTALNAQSMDAVILRRHRRVIPGSREGVRNLYGGLMEAVCWVTK